MNGYSIDKYEQYYQKYINSEKITSVAKSVITKAYKLKLDFIAFINTSFADEEFIKLELCLETGDDVLYNYEYAKIMNKHNLLTNEELKIFELLTYEDLNVNELYEYARNYGYFMCQCYNLLKCRNSLLLPIYFRVEHESNGCNLNNGIYIISGAKNCFIKRVVCDLIGKTHTAKQVEAIVEQMNNDVPFKVISNSDYTVSSIIQIGRAYSTGIDVTKYTNDFKDAELEVIACCLRDNLDPAPMVGRGLNSGQMSIIYLAMKYGLEYGWYLNPSYNFEKMYNLMMLQKMGVDISVYCNQYTTGPELRRIRLEKESECD